MDTTRFRYGVYLLFFFNLLVIISFWWNGSGALFASTAQTGGTLIALGRLTGLLAEFFILGELVLIGRISFIEKMFPYDQLTKLHRWIGLPAAVTLLAHPILLTFGYGARAHLSYFAQMNEFVRDWPGVFLAVIGIFAFTIALASSIFFVRRRLNYEHWRALHLLMYVGIGLAFVHQIYGGDFASGHFVSYWLGLNFLVFGAFIGYRFIRPIILFRKHNFRVLRIERGQGEVTHVVVTGDRMDEFNFSAGQFANILFLRRHFLQFHPFSFSAAMNGKTLRFSIKRLGNFTERVMELREGTPVVIDGPHGHFTLAHAKREKLLFIAGGVGITPILALLDELHGKKRDVVVLYACRDERSIACELELETALECCDGATCAIVLSEAPSGMKAHCVQGRIDHSLITQRVPDVIDREVFVCGPDTMTDAVVSDLISRGLPRDFIHFERFAF